MPDNEACLLKFPTRTPWNKGKLIGVKPPLRPKHVWSIRTHLMIERQTRDLAMFNLAIDSKLRGCDVVALKVEDVAPNGYTIDRATVRQRKMGRPVKFELRDQMREAVDDYLRAAGKEARRISVHGQLPERPGHDDAPIRTTCLQMGRQHRARRQAVRHPLAPADKGYADLPAHRQLAGGPAPARSHEDREHVQISRHRGG
jgi:integrase